MGVTLYHDELLPLRFELRAGPPSPYFRQHYVQTATDAGQLLGNIPEGITPVEFWLDSLLKFCVTERKEYLGTIAVRDDESSHSRTLHMLCEASATYCAWLDVKAIEDASLGTSGHLHRIVTEVVSNFEPTALRSYRSALDHQSQLIKIESEKHAGYQVSDELWAAAKTVLDDASNFIGFSGNFQQQRSPEVLIAQIHAVRQKIEAKLHEVESKAFSSQPGSQGLPITYKSPIMRANEMHVEAEVKAHAQMHFEKKLAELRKSENSPPVGADSNETNELLVSTTDFPNRAKWLKERLKERGWDWNEPNRHGGPDRKTVKKILNGRFVREDMLEKIVVALNRKKVGKTIALLDVPSD